MIGSSTYIFLDAIRQLKKKIPTPFFSTVTNVKETSFVA
jgi:hypothetical protein